MRLCLLACAGHVSPAQASVITSMPATASGMEHPDVPDLAAAVVQMQAGLASVNRQLEEMRASHAVQLEKTASHAVQLEKTNDRLLSVEHALEADYKYNMREAVVTTADIIFYACGLRFKQFSGHMAQSRKYHWMYAENGTTACLMLSSADAANAVAAFPDFVELCDTEGPSAGSAQRRIWGTPQLRHLVSARGDDAHAFGIRPNKKNGPKTSKQEVQRLAKRLLAGIKKVTSRTAGGGDIVTEALSFFEKCRAAANAVPIFLRSVGDDASAEGPAAASAWHASGTSASQAEFVDSVESSDVGAAACS